MIAVATEIAHGAKSAAFVGRHHALSGILNHKQIILFRNFVYLVHLAGDPRIVDRHDCLGLFSNRFFDKFLVQVHRIGADIHEHALRPLRHERIRRAHERERRHNHLVTGSNITESCGHFKGMRATGSHERLDRTRMLLEPLMAPQVKSSVATNTTAFYGLLDIVEFHPYKGRLVKRNFHHNRNINILLLFGHRKIGTQFKITKGTQRR